MKSLFALGAMLLTGALSFADGPANNIATKVRPIPPPGLPLKESDRAELTQGTQELGKAIEQLRVDLKGKTNLLSFLPDIQIFYNAVHYALKYDEFFNPTNEVPAARNLLKLGFERAAQLKEGKTPWNTATGLVVRGYVSKIDRSVQPYGLVVPPTYSGLTPDRFRLDSWFHGRDEKLNEINFLNGRLRSPGEFVPPNAFVLHLYGRYCNANKFAGEIDLFEALEDVQRRYPIDENRLVIRGFSMGGAACWQFATHYASKWVAAAPGAGFSETADFLKVFQKEAVSPPDYEQKLWHMYDATDYALNLYNLPTVAYSGEIDGQRQAADMMAKALEKQGMFLEHIIGPQTGHRYHPDSKIQINKKIDSLAARGRNPLPREIRFSTHTLRYNEMFWVKIEGMAEHWKEARVDASIRSPTAVLVRTTNVTAITLSMPAGVCPFDPATSVRISLDRREMICEPVHTDRSWKSTFILQKDGWSLVTNGLPTELHKVHGLQGPIDDAFMDSFVMVTPTGTPMNEVTGKWVKSEQAHAIEHWRKQFRGEAQVVRDQDLTVTQIAENNLVLWGDPQSNTILAKIADKLPIQWGANGIRLGQDLFTAGDHVPVLIYPNPLNPKRYVVLNSGFTFREYDYLNNARQVPKLPDYAIIDVKVPANSRTPGGILKAGFFTESWRVAGR